MVDVAGREEQQRFEARVVHAVQERGAKADQRKRVQTVALEHESGADAEKNDADVFDRGVREQPLEIVFRQRVQHTAER